MEYQKNDDSEFLINQLEGKTEDAFQYLLIKNFSNEEIFKVRKMRSQRDENLRKVFKKFNKNSDIDRLLKGI